MKIGKNTRSYHRRANELVSNGYSKREAFEICEDECKKENGKGRYTNVDSFRQVNWRFNKK